ncbi:Acg family FMN-binding oxidoreductase [Actinomadura sp. 3N508]|uniref:Acg family FMN-binding oxidoreductase n=1 Tax=Actinomadura sp. 3N508 TaxID=3375153 RepID=UPI0037B11509
MIGATRSAAKSREVHAGPPGREGPDLAARFVVRAAILAPSVHNTQPWRFVDRPGGLELWADRARLLTMADPTGREMVISCGAALFNARLAVRSLGFTPLVRLLPDPAYPDLLARIGWGSGTAPRPYEDLLYRTIPRRHTHRGAFLTTPLPPMLTTVLAGIARHEGAGLRVVSDLAQRRRLAEHIEVAEAAQRRDPRISGELLAWVASPTGERRDGLSPGSYPIQPDGLEFASRDFAAATRWGRRRQGRQNADPDTAHPAAVGTVAVLVTREDRRLDWLLAGQALQHVLLHAETAGVSAAFHTQPLELPYLRAAMHRDLCGHAQMVLRLGRPAHRLRSRRRPVTDVLSGEQNPSTEHDPGTTRPLRHGARS